MPDNNHDMLRELHQYVLGPDGLRDRFNQQQKDILIIQAALIGTTEKPGLIVRFNGHLDEHGRVRKRNTAIFAGAVTLGAAIASRLWDAVWKLLGLK